MLPLNKTPWGLIPGGALCKSEPLGGGLFEGNLFGGGAFSRIYGICCSAFMRCSHPSFGFTLMFETSSDKDFGQ